MLLSLLLLHWSDPFEKQDVFNPWKQNPTKGYTISPISWCLAYLISILVGLAVVYPHFLSLHIANCNIKGEEFKFARVWCWLHLLFIALFFLGVWLALSLLYTCCRMLETHSHYCKAKKNVYHLFYKLYLGMHDIWFLPISDMPIFFNSFWLIADADTEIFPSVWKQHQFKFLQYIYIL